LVAKNIRELRKANLSLCFLALFLTSLNEVKGGSEAKAKLPPSFAFNSLKKWEKRDPVGSFST